MSEPIDNKAHAGGDIIHEEKGTGIAHVDDSHNLDNEAKLEAYKAAAMEAEVAEQQSGVVQAVKEYPMAAFWAFVMSCTIVRRLPALSRPNQTPLSMWCRNYLLTHWCVLVM
jgi:SP family general alpha glucoside:H+ symporter-like MFS transporter